MSKNKEDDSNPENDIDKFVEMFASGSLDVRLQLTKKLVELGKVAIPALIRGLSNKIWSVRQDSANALAEIGDKSAIEHLKITLLDPETGVRYESARALAKIGGDEEKEMLKNIAMNTDDEDFRHFLFDCIAGI